MTKIGLAIAVTVAVTALPQAVAGASQHREKSCGEWTHQQQSTGTRTWNISTGHGHGGSFLTCAKAKKVAQIVVKGYVPGSQRGWNANGWGCSAFESDKEIECWKRNRSVTLRWGN